MHEPTTAAHPVLQEHQALCRAYAAVQERCSRVVAQQRADIERLQGQVLRLRAALIVRDSALAFACAARDEGALSGLAPAPIGDEAAVPWGQEQQDLQEKESLAAARQVICQTGCLSHGAYWRDGNGHCRRTGAACTLPGAPTTGSLGIKTGCNPG